ncbi:MAG: helix-turn-helix domain-containing protein [Gammaproteobacteria bacterium]|nr:helix-turn-helix domain-containing protein [Gammaproteobacteria bacterium]
MKLMGVKEYRDLRYTPESCPSERHIIRLIREGVLPGVKQGKFYYIDIDNVQANILRRVIKII